MIDNFLKCPLCGEDLVFMHDHGWNSNKVKISYRCLICNIKTLDVELYPDQFEWEPFEEISCPNCGGYGEYVSGATLDGGLIQTECPDCSGTGNVIRWQSERKESNDEKMD